MATINTINLIKSIKNRYGAETRWEGKLGGWHAEIETGRGNIGLLFLEKGAYVWKPNGTRKAYYEISNAQLIGYIDRMLDYWKD